MRTGTGKLLRLVGSAIAVPLVIANAAAQPVDPTADGQPSNAAPAVATTASGVATGMTTPRQAVSMRSGPNTSFPVVGTLRPGMPLRILATGNYGWVQVESSQGTGWTYGSYLASGTAVAVPRNAAPAPASHVSPSEITSP